ncbi:MAG: ABC transporter ATP-binding protein [Chloroflexi bacterium]|nr:ABC transporter ATP-binding protein [Chloroflexota bacterium]
MIRLVDLSKVYREAGRSRVVLDGVTETFPAGRVSALLGRSGSGKSTLLNLIAGLDVPTDGEVRINGTALTALGERERTLFRRRHIGFVFQFFNLIPTLSVRENVLLPLELAGAPPRQAQAAAGAMLEAVGLAGRDGDFPDQLSGGEQQRVAIARALVHDPLLVLADEPTGNLDAATGAQVLDLLERLTRQAGKTMLIATHSGEVVRRADHVWCIRDGKLVAEGQGCEFAR